MSITIVEPNIEAIRAMQTEYKLDYDQVSYINVDIKIWKGKKSGQIPNHIDLVFDNLVDQPRHPQAILLYPAGSASFLSIMREKMSPNALYILYCPKNTLSVVKRPFDIAGVDYQSHASFRNETELICFQKRPHQGRILS